MGYCEFYEQSCHKSRKERICECCEREIHIGDYYVNCRGKYEGEFFQRNLCLACEKAISAYCSDVENEFAYDDIYEYSKERVCYDCSKHYEDTCDESIMRCPKVEKYWLERDGGE